MTGITQKFSIMYIFLFLHIVVVVFFFLANNADPKEMHHSVALYLGVHCLMRHPLTQVSRHESKFLYQSGNTYTTMLHICKNNV